MGGRALWQNGGVGAEVPLDGIVSGTPAVGVRGYGERSASFVLGDVLGGRACDVSTGTRLQGSWSVRRPSQL